MPKVYPTEEIERGLHAVATYGSTRLAERALERAGYRISCSTLEGWKKQHAARLDEIKATVLPALREKMAERSEELAFSYAEAEALALSVFEAKAHELQGKDAANAAKNFAIARGVSTDKASALRGMPTEIHEHRRVEEITKRWHSQGWLEGTAEEIHDTRPETESPSTGARLLATGAETNDKTPA